MDAAPVIIIIIIIIIIKKEKILVTHIDENRYRGTLQSHYTLCLKKSM